MHGGTAISGRVTWVSLELIAGLQHSQSSPGPSRGRRPRARVLASARDKLAETCGQAQIHISQQQKHMTGHAARGRAARASTRQGTRAHCTQAQTLSCVAPARSPGIAVPVPVPVPVLLATPSPKLQRIRRTSSVYRTRGQFAAVSAIFTQLALLPSVCRLSWHSL